MESNRNAQVVQYGSNKCISLILVDLFASKIVGTYGSYVLQ
jgi:hypothetical protein